MSAVTGPGGGPFAGGAVTVEEIGSEDGFLALRDEWNGLLSRSGSDVLFLTHEWLVCWWKHFGRPLSLRGRAAMFVLAARRNGKLCGAAPLLLTRYRYFGVPLRLVGFLGQGISDYSDFLVDEAEGREEVLSAFADHLAARPGLWDAIDLRNGYGRSGNLPAFEAGLARAGCFSRVDPEGLCRVIPIRGDWDSYYQGCCSGEVRRAHRKEWRRLCSAGETDVRFLESPDEARGLIELLAGIEREHPLAGPGRPGFLQKGPFRGFIEEFIPLAAERGWLNVAVTDCGGVPAAYYVTFRYNGRFYAYITSYRKEFRKYGIGRLTFIRLMERFWLSGKGEIDLLRGEEEYKENWAAEGHRNVRLVAGRRSARSRAAARAWTGIIPALEHRLPRIHHAFVVSNEAGWGAVARRLLRRLDPRGKRP